MRIPWISFGTWERAGDRWTIRERIYVDGCKWTPFVWVSWRYRA